MAELPANNTFCWNELATRDTAACTKFYSDLFGWTANSTPMGHTVYTVFSKDDKQLAGMLQMTAEWGDIRPHWMPYVAVDDPDKYAKRIVELGGKVCVPPTDIPVGRFAVVEDPTGAVFSIIRLKAM